MTFDPADYADDWRYGIDEARVPDQTRPLPVGPPDVVVVGDQCLHCNEVRFHPNHQLVPLSPTFHPFEEKPDREADDFCLDCNDFRPCLPGAHGEED